MRCLKGVGSLVLLLQGMSQRSAPAAADDNEGALRFLQQQRVQDSTLVSSIYLDDPDFQTYKSRYSPCSAVQHRTTSTQDYQYKCDSPCIQIGIPR